MLSNVSDCAQRSQFTSHHYGSAKAAVCVAMLLQMGLASSAKAVSGSEGTLVTSLSPKSNRDPSPAELGLLRSQSTTKQVSSKLEHLQTGHTI